MIGTSKLLFYVLLPVPLFLSPARDPPLVRVAELHMDIFSSHGVTTNTCLSVGADGHFHLEVHHQQLPTSVAELHIYEGNLDGFQLVRLESLLDALRDEEPFQQPTLPIPTSFSIATVRIPRARQIDTLGFLTWDARTDKPNEKPDLEPAEAEEQWRRSRSRLIPLLNWSHELRLAKMTELPEFASTLCEEDSSNK